MSGSAPTVLLAHERPGIARAVVVVLERHGFAVTTARDGVAAQAALTAKRWGALVVDVALPGVPGYDLIRIAKSLAEQGDSGASLVVLVSSVYRRTSYKRRPARLYGADDYVEIHHLGDMLPSKLERLLGSSADVDEADRLDLENEAADALRAEGDSRMQQYDIEGLASLIVADMILYNGDEILSAKSAEAARAAVADDLDIARDLLGQVAAARGDEPPAGDPAGAAFDHLMKELGRKQGVR